MAIQMQLQSSQSFSYLENMVSKPTWKDILLELISSNSIDPWNIDLLILADRFIKKVREMERMDFVIQANVILAASILLKYKSDYLKFLSYQTDIPEFAPDNEALAPGIEEFPQLALSSRIPPKRQITLDELIGEMERIIKYDDVDRIHVPRGTIVETVDLDLGEHDIDRDLERIALQIRNNTDAEGWSLFSKITDGYEMQERVYTLLCILHLVQTGTVDIRQDELFGEIFICTLKKDQD